VRLFALRVVLAVWVLTGVVLLVAAITVSVRGEFGTLPYLLGSLAFAVGVIFVLLRVIARSPDRAPRR
jgi:hypothetical protein